MQWQIVVALVLAIPILLFPVAYIWYINVGGIVAAIRERKARTAAEEQGVRVIAR